MAWTKTKSLQTVKMNLTKQCTDPSGESSVIPSGTSFPLISWYLILLIEHSLNCISFSVRVPVLSVKTYSTCGHKNLHRFTHLRQYQSHTHTNTHTHAHTHTCPSSSLRSDVLTWAFWSLSSWYKSRSQPIKKEPRNFCISTVTYSEMGIIKLYNTRKARKSEINFKICKGKNHQRS